MVCDGSSKLPLVVGTETALLAPPPGAGEEEDSSSWEEVRLKQQQQQQQAGDDTTALSSGDMCTTYTPPTAEARTDGGSAHASPKQQAGTGSSSLSLADRQRLQREAQLTFLRTQGLLKDGDDVRGGAGAGAESPRVRDGIASPLTRSPFLVVAKSPGGTLSSPRQTSPATGSTASDDRADNAGPTDSSPASPNAASASVAAPAASSAASNKTKRDSFLSFPSLERRGSALSPRWGSNNTSRRSSVDNGAATTNASPTVRRFEYPLYPEVISSLSFQKSGNTNTDDAMSSALSAARKAGVAVAGGALVAAGAIVAVAPTPGGILLAGAGLGVLSTEFEGAKTVLDKGKSKLVDLIDRVEGDGDGNDGDGDSGGDINESSKKEKKVGEDGEEQKHQEDGKEQNDDEGIEGDDDDPSPPPRDDHQVEGESSTTSTSPDSSTLTTTAQTARVAPASATVAANTPSSAELKAALRTRARKIGKSIRPLLTDDDAPRRAMDEVKASTNRAVGEMKSSTHRALGRMRSHLNEIVDTFAVPDEAGGLPGWTNPNSSSINGNVDANDGSNVSANDTNGSADGATTTTTTTTTSNAPSSRDNSLRHEPKVDTSLSTDGKEGKDSGEALHVNVEEMLKGSQEDEEETATATASVSDMTDSSAAQ